MSEEYIEELEDKVDELEDKNLHNKAWKDFYADENIKLRKANEQLQNNWNELKKWLEEEYKYIPRAYCRMFQKIFNKMQELEGNNDSKRDV